MSSYLMNKLENAVEDLHLTRVADGLYHAKETTLGLLNPNRRHDDPAEKAADELRRQINEEHRFDSFAERRPDNFVKWHIDGHDFMWAVSELIDSAKEAIFILDWWLTPELYLRRPPAEYPEWRLDRLLQRKATEGVKIYVIVYKEVTQTMSMSSSHTKKALEALHVNIACMRHPDHIGSKDDVEFWSHHEKVVVVDNHYASIGGLDLCFGRWDTHTHPLADAHPHDFARTLFPGQDFNNARITDFKDVFNYVGNTLSVLENPRMPWHDVHMTIAGPSVLDIVQHFTERWNEVKKRKYKHDHRYDWLSLPHDIESAPQEAVARHPHRAQWHEMGKQFRERFHLPPREIEQGYVPPPCGSCQVQVVRSVSDWSHGVLTEHSIQNAYIRLIREANHFVYIENQFFISSTYGGDPVKNQIAAALVERIVQAATDGVNFKVIVVIPEVPGFAGTVKSDSSVQTIMAAQYRTINRGGHSIYEEVKKAGFDPKNYIRFFHLRAYDRIHAPLKSLITPMEEKSKVLFHDAQVALARVWIGDTALPGEIVPESVDVLVPQETSEGLVPTTATATKTIKAKVPATEKDARDLIKQFEDAAETGHDVADNVVQHMMQDRTALTDEIWEGTEEEELDAYVTELLYIHSKVMIVDDRVVIMGSANLNDRSQRGDGDSEIALVVEDTDMIRSKMDGKPYMAARFAATLRRKLFREHLGLIEPQRCDPGTEPTGFMRPAPIPNPDEIGTPEDLQVEDPVAEATMTLWNSTAEQNRAVFTEIFHPVPTNLVRDWNAYNTSGYVPKVKTGHVAPGVTLAQVKARLPLVRGALVDMPLDFLADQADFVNNSTWSSYNPTLPVYI